MNSELKLLKSLADPIRLRIVMLLRSGELCVCELTRVLDLPQSTVSRHMARLKADGLVVARREAQWMHYRLQTSEIPAYASLKGFFDTLAPESPYREDRARMAAKTDNCRSSLTAVKKT